MKMGGFVNSVAWRSALAAGCLAVSVRMTIVFATNWLPRLIVYEY